MSYYPILPPPRAWFFYVIVTLLLAFGVYYTEIFLREQLISLYSNFNDTPPIDFLILILIIGNGFSALAVISLMVNWFLSFFGGSLGSPWRVFWIIMLISVIIPIIATSGEWHLNRNKYNIRLSGKLVPKTNASPDYVYNPGSDNLYVDNNGLEWKLLPGYLSLEHQPEKHEWCDYSYPNKKFVHRHGVGSSEVILEPPLWVPIVRGKLQESFNYIDPGGILVGLYCERQVLLNNVNWEGRAKGALRDIGHLVVDMIPHYIANDFFSKSYKPTNR